MDCPWVDTQQHRRLRGARCCQKVREIEVIGLANRELLIIPKVGGNFEGKGNYYQILDEKRPLYIKVSLETKMAYFVSIKKISFECN